MHFLTTSSLFFFSFVQASSLFELTLTYPLQSSNAQFSQPLESNLPFQFAVLISMLSLIIFSLTSLLPQALACAEHQNYHRATTSPTTTDRKWEYAESFDWGRADPAYELCQSGTQQSPISLTLQNGLSTKHAPTFNYPDQVDGNFYNWDFGETLYSKEFGLCHLTD